MKLHNFKQGTLEWQKIRLGKLTASHAQAISSQGKGLETLAYNKVAEILTGKAEEGYTNGDMERGHELEMMARNAYELETGNLVKEVGFCQLDEHCGCSPDGLVGDEGLVEFKCPNNKVFVEYMYSKKVDTGYVWQMQMQMFITDRKWCDYAVFAQDFPKSLIVKRIERDEEAIKKIKAGIEEGKTMIEKIMKEII